MGPGSTQPLEQGSQAEIAMLQSSQEMQAPSSSSDTEETHDVLHADIKQ